MKGPLMLLVTLCGALIAFGATSAWGVSEGNPRSEQGKPHGNPIDNADLASDVAIRVTIGFDLTFSLEYGCPSPGILACASGVRIRIGLGSSSSSALTRNFGSLAIAALSKVGASHLAITHHRSGRAGQIVSGGDDLLRWKRSRGVLEVVGGDLQLRPGANLPPRQSSYRRSSHGGPFSLELDPRTLGLLLRSLPHR